MREDMAQNLVAFILVFAFLYHGNLLGQRLFWRHPWIVSIFPGMVLFLALQSILQTLWYYADQPLGNTSDLATFIFTVFLIQVIRLVVPKTTDTQDDEEAAAPPGRLRRLIVLLNLFVAAAAAGLILRGAQAAATLESIRTPWPLLPERTLPMIALVWLTLILSTLLIRSRWISAIHATLALGPTLAITALVYRIGFGFDGFLHIASEKILLATGTLHPKPLYYLGQYVFTTWLARLTHIPLSDIDRWLVPVVATILLPVCLFLILQRRTHATFTFLILGLLPLGGFISTTPQGFAYTLGLAALLLGAAATENRAHPLASLILAGWAVAVHPLAGIPLTCVLIAVLVRHQWKNNLGRVLSWAFVLLAGTSIPILFYIIGLRTGTSIAWNFPSLFEAEPWLERLRTFWPFIGNRFVLWPAWATLVARSLPVILLGLAISGSIVNRKQNTDQKTEPIWIASAIALWLAATFLKTSGDFAFLIDYERGNYADRLNLLALLCLIPAAIPGLIALWKRVRLAPAFVTIALIGFLMATGTALAYDSLPRHDALVTGRGWSTSRYDMEAVTLIDRDAAGRDYSVLANQSVSAAAVATLGFKRYAGDVFFYPIPTGGVLYEQFLRMTYNEPSYDTVKDAAELGKTDLVYVVINDYWWRAAVVSETLRSIAERDWSIGNGKINVYKFDLSNDSNSPTTTSTR